MKMQPVPARRRLLREETSLALGSAYALVPRCFSDLAYVRSDKVKTLDIASASYLVALGSSPVARVGC